MSSDQRRNLADYRLKLYAGFMSNHDFLWFSSLEISKVAATIPIIHSYALSYAINGFSYGICTRNFPTYDSDISQMLANGAYATPATPRNRVRSTRFTQNALDSMTLMTAAPNGKNSPSLGFRIVLNPAVEWDAGFSFYLFADSNFRPPAVVRLGKKGCPVRFSWEELPSPVAVFSKTATQPTHALNPLDIAGQVVSCEPVSIPPHMLFKESEIRQDWFVFAGKHKVHVPKRIFERKMQMAGAEA